jgi:arsenate reductase (thioredoxin)
MTKTRVLFGCTHNSARSQMAEAFLRTLGGDAFEAFSAGVDATGIRPETVTVMEEIGISLEGQRSKTIDEFRGQPIDVFITVCADAREACPFLPGVPTSDHWGIDDPAAVEDPGRLDAFRRARDELRDRIQTFVAEIDAG